MDYIKYEDLDYGAYLLNPDLLGSYVESKKYTAAEYNKLNVQKVRLPDGTGNVCYLLAKDLPSVLNLTKNFQLPATYRRLYYPIWDVGTFLARRYKYSIDRKQRDNLIKTQTKLAPYLGRVLPKKTKENILFSVDAIYSAIEPIMQKATVKRLTEDFYPQLLAMLRRMSPEVDLKKKDINSGHRILVIDCESFNFKQGARLADNKTNPLYILYLKFLRHLDTSGIDIDILIVSKNMFMKFNPAKVTRKDWQNFRVYFFRIMKVNLDDYTEQLEEEEKKELQETSKDKVVENIVKTAVDPYVSKVSGSTKQVLTDAVEKKVRINAAKKVDLDTEIKKAVDRPVNVFDQHVINPAKAPMDPRLARMFKSVAGSYSSLASDTGIEYDDEDEDEEVLRDYEDEIEDETREVLVNDDDVKEEVIDQIQDNVAPLDHPNSPVNSERDKKLREEQKKVVVGTETIEQILERDTSNVPIKTEDKSAVMHTTNPNMKTMRFANFDKTYLDELYVKDIVSVFDSLKDKEYPFYVTSIEIHDTSNSQYYQDTWTVTLVDEVNKKYTIRVDIPKFQNDRFMWLNGSRFMILKQNFYYPLVKDTPDTVMMTTNFNKVTIERKATKSLTEIERMYSLVKKTGDTKMFTAGDSSKSNMRYISTLEYDELSNKIFKYTSGECEIYFSREYIKDNLKMPSNMKPDEFYIGHEGNTPILINEDTGLDRIGRTIIQIMEQHLPDNYKTIYENIRGPKQSMYVHCKMAGQWIPVITALIVWNGLKKSLDEMKIQWKFDDQARRVPPPTANKKYIRFADGVLEYENKVYAELIMNGLSLMHPEVYNFNDFESETGYDDFMYATWGSYNGINEVRQFKQFLIDPITDQVCKDLMLPNTPSGLLIHAVKLLSDNAYVSKASDTSYRVRSIEIIPAILYSCLADQYKAYVRSGRRVPMTLNQRCVMSKLMDAKSGAGKQVEAYSTLNPVVEVSRTHTISTKGYRGSNSDHAYKDEQKRSYDPSAVGKLAMSTDPEPIKALGSLNSVNCWNTVTSGNQQPIHVITWQAQRLSKAYRWRKTNGKKRVE